MEEKDNLIVEQQLKIRKLELIMNEYKEQLDDISNILYCVGGPLNDRWHHYNKKVDDAFIPEGYCLAEPLIKISKLVSTYDSIDNFVGDKEDNEE